MTMHRNGATTEVPGQQVFQNPADILEAVAKSDLHDAATPEESAWLRRPENLDHWREILVGMIQDTQAAQTRARSRVELAREDRGAYLAATKQHAQWSARANYFRKCVEVRLRECKRLIRERDDERRTAEKLDLGSRVEDLESQVLRLRKAVRKLALAVEEGAGS